MTKQNDNIISEELGLKLLVDDYVTGKQTSLIRLKKGTLTKEEFLAEAKNHLMSRGLITRELTEKILKAFEDYIYVPIYCKIF